MNLKIASFVVVSAFLGLTAACSQAPSDASEPASDEGALATGTSKLVGSWTESSDSGDVGFYAIQLRKSGTFHATGGCKPSDSGPHCFAIVELDGKWTATSTGELDLVDQFDQTTKLAYSFTGDDLVLKKGSAAPATFTKASSGAIHPGGVCKDGDKCTSGYECRSNCPKDAECIMAIDTCQPKVKTVKAGGVCQLGQDSAPCATGYTCKSNCPMGAMCLVSINVCTKD